MSVDVLEPKEIGAISTLEPKPTTKSSPLPLEQLMAEIKYRGTKEDIADVKTALYSHTAKIQESHHLSLRWIITVVIGSIALMFSLFFLALRFFSAPTSFFY